MTKFAALFAPLLAVTLIAHSRAQARAFETREGALSAGLDQLMARQRKQIARPAPASTPAPESAFIPVKSQIPALIPTQPNSVKSSSEKDVEKVLKSIDEVSLILGTWNPDITAKIARDIFIKRIQLMGARKGFAEPTLLLIDLAVLAGRDDIATSLAPSISRLYPKIGDNLNSSLGFDRRSLLDPSKIVGRDLDFDGTGSRSSRKSSHLGREFRDLDPTGMTDAIMGPDSIIGRALKNDRFNPRYQRDEDRSPTYGLSRADIASCFARCSEQVRHGATVGGAAGAVAGPIAGGAIGAALGWEVGGPVGALKGGYDGVKDGTKYGPPAGALVGGVIAGAVCAAKTCGGTDESKSDDPKPAPQEPGQVSPETPENDSDTTDPKDCKEKSCGDAMPIRNDDDGGGETPSDTGPTHPIRPRRTAERILQTSKAPWVNPVRGGDDFGGFDFKVAQ